MADLERLGTRTVSRSPDEIKARIKVLERHIEQNDVWIWIGPNERVPAPEHERLQNIFSAKLNELRWLLGEEVEVTQGVH